jgi:glutaredoxin 3
VYQRCEKHNLAAGPDGKCALCRRSVAPAFTNIEEKPGWISRTATVLLGLATVVAVGLTVWWVRSPGESPLNPDYLGQESALRGIGYAVPDDSASAGAGVEEGAERPGGSGPAVEEGSVKADETTKPLTEEEKARRKVSIALYGTEYCPVSEQAREYMRRRGIAFVERDIDSDEEALAHLEKINPLRSTPTFEVDDEVLIGFSEQKLNDAIDRAAAKRLKRRTRR